MNNDIHDIERNEFDTLNRKKINREFTYKL